MANDKYGKNSSKINYTNTNSKLKFSELIN